MEPMRIIYLVFCALNKEILQVFKFEGKSFEDGKGFFLRLPEYFSQDYLEHNLYYFYMVVLCTGVINKKYFCTNCHQSDLDIYITANRP